MIFCKNCKHFKEGENLNEDCQHPSLFYIEYNQLYGPVTLKHANRNLNFLRHASAMNKDFNCKLFEEKSFLKNFLKKLKTFLENT